MQFQPAEGEFEREGETVRHQAGPRVRREGVIAEIRAVKRAADDLAEVEHADDRVVADAADEQPGMRRGMRVALRAGAEARDVVAKPGDPVGRPDPAAVQGTARAGRGEKRIGVAKPWRTNVHAWTAVESDWRRARRRGWHNDNLTFCRESPDEQVGARQPRRQETVERSSRVHRDRGTRGQFRRRAIRPPGVAGASRREGGDGRSAVFVRESSRRAPS